ncbi:MAG: nucleotidyl transferase AbiEii/AbiGii toxin family protein [Bacteroidales bacterium]|nr:nucleotidyl transferase AbiEii/AbiGii toxin family protein [Bacteroidales bacterium]
MLSLDQIKQHYPESLHGYERFMLREYLQYKILEILFDSKYANKFAFIGGTALRIVHGNERFSEYLDFDHFDLTPELFSEVTKVIQHGLQLEGYQVQIRSVSRIAFHCYIRFPKLLYDYKLSGHEEEKILIRLDTKAQRFDFKPEDFLLNRFDVFTGIKVTPPDLLLAQKFCTILERKQCKGRDFYDVVFLMGKGVNPDYNFLNQKAAIKNGFQLKAVILEKLDGLDMELLTEDVRPFLLRSKDVNKVTSFKEYIMQVDL